MNRRGFLTLAAPAVLILPELLIPKRSFFLPPMGGWATEIPWSVMAWDDSDVMGLIGVVRDASYECPLVFTEDGLLVVNEDGTPWR